MSTKVDETYGKQGLCPTTSELAHFPRHASGSAKLLLSEDKREEQLDIYGTTNPNLHRRVNSKQPPLKEGQPEVDNTDVFPREEREVLPRDYHFTVQENNSFRTVRNHIQDEDSDVSEIP